MNEYLFLVGINENNNDILKPFVMYNLNSISTVIVFLYLLLFPMFKKLKNNNKNMPTILQDYFSQLPVIFYKI